LIALPWFHSFEVKRPEANGGNKRYSSMEELEADYISGALHPGEPMCNICHTAGPYAKSASQAAVPPPSLTRGSPS